MAPTPSHRETEQKLNQYLTTLGKAVDKVNNTVSRLAEDGKRDDKSIEKQERYSGVESDLREEEVTQAVASHYQEQGFEIIKMPIKVVFNRQGHTVLEVGGFFSVSRSGHKSVVLVEAKHQVSRAEIVEKAGKYRKIVQLMAELREEAALPVSGHQLWCLTAGQLWQYRHCDIIWFMAGALLNEGLRAEAQAQGFRLVLVNGCGTQAEPA